MFFNPFSHDPFGAFTRQPQQPIAPTNPTPTQYHNTPPASSRQIASLPIVTITIDDLQEQSNKECLICLEEQKLGNFLLLRIFFKHVNLSLKYRQSSMQTSMWSYLP